MNRKLILAVLLLMGTSSMAQISGAGIQPKANFTNQIIVWQHLDPKFARSANNLLSSAGVDAYMDIDLGEKWKFRTKAGVETKGFVSTSAAYPLQDRTHKFNHVTLDANILKFWGAADRKIKLYNYVGLTGGYAYSQKTPSYDPWYPPTPFVDPTAFISIDYEKYDRFNLGGVAGIGLSFGEFLWLELEYGRDILYSLTTPEYKVYNNGHSINMGVNVLEVLRKM